MGIWKINRSALVLVTLPFIVIGIIFIILAFNTKPGARTADGYPLNIFYLIMGGFYIIFITGLVTGIILWRRREQKKVEWFKKFGISGIAEIIFVEQTGVYINKLPQMVLKLNVTTGMSPPYTVTIKKVFSFLEVGKLTPGAKLQVLVDPQNPKNILIL